MINKIFNYIFLISPILVTSLFIPYSEFPAWAVTLTFASLITSISLFYYVYLNWKKEKAFGNLVINTSSSAGSLNLTKE